MLKVVDKSAEACISWASGAIAHGCFDEQAPCKQIESRKAHWPCLIGSSSPARSRPFERICAHALLPVGDLHSLLDDRAGGGAVAIALRWVFC